MREPNYLFSQSDLRGVLENHEQKMLARIDDMDADEFLNTSPDDFAEYLIEEFKVEVPVLQFDRIEVDQGETKIDVSRDFGRVIYDRSQPFYLTGTRVSFHIPFEGDANLFKCQASSRSMNPPQGIVRDGELELSYSRLDHDSAAVKAEFERELSKVQQHLGWAANDVRPFNDALPAKVKDRIASRREKLLADRGLAEALGYPMRVRGDAPSTYVVPTKPRKPPIQRPRPKAKGRFKPDPIMEKSDYERILSILSSMVQVIERSPGAFKRMKEEDLRQHFLVQLNGHYEGQATGETFNFEGKTDILVRAEGRNIFIAESKFWRGSKSLAQTIDQLLGYTSWRDTKTAILLFNRGKNLSDVLAKIPAAITTHPNFKREIHMDGETEFRYVFAHRDDPNREIIITVLVFEVPS